MKRFTPGGVLRIAILAAIAAMGLRGAHAQFVATDDAGYTVNLKSPAARIVALEPFLAELVFALGAGSRLVGVSRDTFYPPEVFAIPKTSGPGIFIAEQLPLMKPDLVLAWAQGIQPEEVDRIRAAGSAVFVAQARRIEDVPRILRALGALTARDPSPLILEYQRKLLDLHAANVHKQRVTVLLELQHRPLTTVSAGHFLGEALEICRAENVFSTQVAVVPQVLWEQVLRRNPWAIIGVSSASNEEEFRKNWSVRRALQAVEANRLAFIGLDMTQQPTTRTPDQVAKLCDALDKLRH